MDGEKLRAFMDKYQCGEQTARYYYDLREEGVAREQALVWCGLRDPNA